MIPSITEERFKASFTRLQSAVHDTAVEKGWWSSPVREHGTSIALMHSELSEALEILRSSAGIETPDPKIPGQYAVTVELADVVIRIMDFCAYYRLDIAAAIIEKAKVNQSRPFMHGGKLF